MFKDPSVLNADSRRYADALVSSSGYVSAITKLGPDLQNILRFIIRLS